jgi:hypothetical protein
LSYLDLEESAITDSLQGRCLCFSGFSWVSGLCAGSGVSLLSVSPSLPPSLPPSQEHMVLWFLWSLPLGQGTTTAVPSSLPHRSPEAGLPRTRMFKRDVLWWLINYILEDKNKQTNKQTNKQGVQTDAGEGLGQGGKHQLMQPLWAKPMEMFCILGGLGICGMVFHWTLV